MNSNNKPVHGNEEFFRESQVSWAALELTKEYPPLWSQVGVFFLFFFVAAAGFYAYYTEIPVVVEGPGRITSETPPLPVKAQTTFTVDQILVSENQFVRKGQTLVTSLENLKPDDVAKLSTFLNFLKKINRRDERKLCMDCLEDINAAMHVYLGIRAQGDILNIISPINDQIRTLKTHIEVYKQIEGGLTATRLQIKNAQRKLNEIKIRRAEKILAKEVEELEAGVVAAQTQISEKYRAGGQQIRDLRATIRVRSKELDDRLSQFGRVHNVVAPLDGRVSNLKLKGTGELISAGQALMELVPAHTPMMAAIDIQNKDITQIKVGDEVIVTVDSLPELDYGNIKGRIKEIIRVDNTELENGRAQVAAGDKNYRINVQLAAQSLKKGNENVSLILGMSLRGRVVTRFETLLKSLYRALFRVKDNIQVTQ